MDDAERFKLLHGPYKAPLFTYGEAMQCAFWGDVIACGLSSGRIPWPIGKRDRKGARGRFLIVTGDLEKAIRTEAGIAISYWWGVSEFSVTRWRQELGVGPITEGTRRLHYEHALEPAGQAAIQKAIARAREPEVRAKMGATRRGRPMHPNARKALDARRAARKGQPLSEEHRRKIAEGLRRLGPNAPWMAKAWKPEEDAMVLTLPPEEVVKNTGRTLNAVKCRKRQLLAAVKL